MESHADSGNAERDGRGNLILIEIIYDSEMRPTGSGFAVPTSSAIHALETPDISKSIMDGCSEIASAISCRRSSRCKLCGIGSMPICLRK